MLGLNRNVIKAHGSSNRNHVCGAVNIAMDLVRNDMLGQMQEDIRGANDILRPFSNNADESN